MKSLALCLLFVSATASAQTLDARVDAARAQRIGGNAKVSASQLTQIVAESPDHFRAQYNLGLALVAEGKDDDGLAALKQASQLGEKQGNPDATIYNTLGWQLLQMGRNAEAVETFEKGVKLEGSLSDASKSRLFNNYGVALMQSLRYADAEKAFKRASEEFQNPLAAKYLKLVQSINSESGRWAVVFGGDVSAVAAQDEIKRAAKLGVANAYVVYREGSYRSIVEFSQRGDADKAAAALKPISKDNYVVQMDSWCPNAGVDDKGAKTCSK